MRRRTSGGRDFQDELLQQLCEARQVTTVYLRNRMSVRGRILKLGPYCLLMDALDDNPPTLIYKSAIVSISGPRRGRRRPGRAGPRRPAPPREERRPPPTPAERPPVSE